MKLEKTPPTSIWTSGCEGIPLKTRTQQEREAREAMEWEVIDVYTRADAIADGVLVDLMQPEFLDLFRDAGIKFPCAMTADAFETYVNMSPELQKKTGQDIKGRLWDILWMFRQTARRSAPGTDTLYFKFVGTTDRLVTIEHTLKAVVGPGDHGEPVITFMHPWED